MGRTFSYCSDIIVAELSELQLGLSSLLRALLLHCTEKSFKTKRPVRLSKDQDLRVANRGNVMDWGLFLSSQFPQRYKIKYKKRFVEAFESPHTLQ